MTDQDRCGIVSAIHLSSRGRADAFARKLHLRIRSLGINQSDDDDDEATRDWYPNENGVDDFESPPLSPEDGVVEISFLNSTMSNINTNDDGLPIPEQSQASLNDHNIVPNFAPNASINLDNLKSLSETVEGPTGFSSETGSVDETYETASDNSTDNETWDSIPNRSRTENSDTTITQNENLSPNNTSSRENPEISVTLEGGDNSLNSNHSDGNEETTPKLRRCSSLKTGKTPPGTPSKKIVRFADALGLDLADVKTFVDEIPKVPTSAFRDLQNVDDDPVSSTTNLQNQPGKMIILMFSQPVGKPDFLDIVRNKFVCLENALVEDQFSFAIRGLVRVRNVAFHKSVLVRYTIDSWRSFIDIQATYVQNSCDGFSDKFTFLVYANILNPGQTLEMAIAFQARGEQFWDNNNGLNYCFRCVSTNSTTSSSLTYTSPPTWREDHCNAAFY